MIGVSAPVLLTQMYRFDVTSRPAVRKTHLSFLNFSYVCLEPVLVKRSFLYINGAKGGVFLTEGAAEGEVNRLLRKANHHNLHTGPYAKTTRFGEDVRPEPVLESDHFCISQYR